MPRLISALILAILMLAGAGPTAAQDGGDPLARLGTLDEQLDALCDRLDATRASFEAASAEYDALLARMPLLQAPALSAEMAGLNAEMQRLEARIVEVAARNWWQTRDAAQAAKVDLAAERVRARQSGRGPSQGILDGWGRRIDALERESAAKIATVRQLEQDIDAVHEDFTAIESMMAGFSSRPPSIRGGGLKPDVTAPGVSVLADAAEDRAPETGIGAGPFIEGGLYFPFTYTDPSLGATQSLSFQNGLNGFVALRFPIVVEPRGWLAAGPGLVGGKLDYDALHNPPPAPATPFGGDLSYFGVTVGLSGGRRLSDPWEFGYVADIGLVDAQVDGVQRGARVLSGGEVTPYARIGGGLFRRIGRNAQVGFTLQAERIFPFDARIGAGAIGHGGVTSLSAGVQMRVAIGRALAGKPKLLILDEPVAGPAGQ